MNDNSPVPFTQRHSRLLEAHDSKLDDHTRKLDNHTIQLSDHGRLLTQLVETQGVHSQELHRLGLLMENSQKDTNIILDVVLSIQGQLDKNDKFENKLVNHEDRISALEKFAQKSIQFSSFLVKRMLAHES